MSGEDLYGRDGHHTDPAPEGGPANAEKAESGQGTQVHCEQRRHSHFGYGNWIPHHSCRILSYRYVRLVLQFLFP